MSQLTGLHIVDHLHDDECLLLPKAANISRIHLASLFRHLEFEFPAPSITHLDLIGLPISLVAKLLLGCPNLVEFRCRVPTCFRTQDLSIVVSSPLIFNHLPTFAWSMCPVSSSNMEKEVLGSIHLPALTTFHWYSLGATNMEMDYSRVAFLSRLPKSLETLQFSGIYTIRSTDNPLQYVWHATNVTEIQIFSCTPVFVQYVLSSLSQGTDHDSTLFPHLTRISIEYSFEERLPQNGLVQFSLEIGIILAQMLRS
ncbi:hypothetical protein AGABI1DRAFT_126394 [Agaricus bisporus var. burnettii JB137-S8]|uniref:F-box domain-containing protein n=1 Tax=Agaricus bisporus var. burnettii (strain JB137-S8 / ATCC MYA-4627 / FGSC 10392) TaxID=597362 RepID=K5X2K6_AGABU|nr:uncharacterized protein AGABI1DRAFT_126394 [Agaricus bisporus var. burnettii JB137-S8]EKM82046.1 hypothetical protein AGABI1DRAFT_126394 [Agaricus bisporus var. burnettii JB137-S8]